MKTFLIRITDTGLTHVFHVEAETMVDAIETTKEFIDATFEIQMVEYVREGGL